MRPFESAVNLVKRHIVLALVIVAVVVVVVLPGIALQFGTWH
jgi:hypothetical protein